MVGSAAIYASFGVLIGILNREQGVDSQIIFRYGLAMILYMFVIILTKTKIKIPPSGGMPIFAFGVVLQLSIWLFTRAATLMSIPSLLGYFYIGTIIMGNLLGLFFFREKIASKNIFATVLTIAGLYFLTRSGNANGGELFAIAAGSMECTANAIRKKLHNVSKGTITLISLFSILLFTIIGATISGSAIQVPHYAASWGAGAIFAVLVVLVNILVTYGFRVTQIHLASVIMSLEILFGAVFSVVFMSVFPTQSEVAVGMLLLISVAIQNARVNNESKAVKFVRNILEG